MSKGDGRNKKEEYFVKLKGLLEEYKAIFIVNVDNVGSNQMHQIRQSLRGQGVVLMGKNTMVRRALKIMLAENPQFEKLMPHVKGNVGFVFTNNDLKEIRDKIVSNRVAAPAKAGALAPDDVWIPGGNTGMEPGKTSFFQALDIPTKIARGTIEIVQDIHIVHAGTKVGASEAALLNMLGISPFTYGMTVIQIYSDGTSFPPEILDIEESSLITQFLSGIKTIAAISLAAHYPTLASVPHSLVNGYKDVLSVAISIDYQFPLAEKVFAYLADPSAFQVAAAVETSAPEAAAPVEEKKEEPEGESDDDMGFGLFD
jgi:large subunit ribosomal protein LP0